MSREDRVAAAWLDGAGVELGGPALQALQQPPDRSDWQLLRLRGSEAMNSLYRYDLWVRHPRLPGDLRPLLGRELRVGLRCAADAPSRDVPDAGALRHLCGVVAEVRQLGPSACGGSQARWVLRPWAQLAQLRVASRMHQQRSVVEVLQQVLRGYAWEWELRLQRSYPRLDYLAQFDQSDWDFVQYLCGRWGLHYHFEHHRGGHRLVIGDGPHALRAQPVAGHAAPTLRAAAACADAPALHHLSEQAALGVQAWEGRSQPECSPRDARDWRACAAAGSPPACGTIERWRGSDGIGLHRGDGARARAASGGDDADEQLNRIRLRQARRGCRLLRGAGPLPGLCAGHLLRLPAPQLAGGPRLAGPDGASHLVLATCLDWCADAERATTVWMDFDAVALADGVEPAPPWPRARVPGTQTATVLDADAPLPDHALAVDALPVDALGRVKVRLHWAADQPDAATCWLRVALPAAGDGFGSAAWPRAADEVLVEYLDGDLDCPLCIGVVRNAAHAPPWELAQARALAGWKTRETQCGEAAAGLAATNHLLLDDTPGGLQAQLACSAADSALCLGRHVALADDGQRQPARGEGAELRTAAAGAVRAARALLVLGAVAGEAAQALLLPLQACRQRLLLGLRARLTLRRGGADAAWPAGAALDELEADVGARAAAPTTPGGDAVLALRADRALLAASAGDLALASQAHLACSAQRDLSALALRGMHLHAAGGVRLGAAGAGLLLRASTGTLRLQARRESLRVQARDAVQLACAQVASLQAGGRLVLRAGGHSVVFGPQGIEHASSGRWRVRAAAHHWLAAAADAPAEPPRQPGQDPP